MPPPMQAPVTCMEIFPLGLGVTPKKPVKSPRLLISPFPRTLTVNSEWPATWNRRNLRPPRGSVITTEPVWMKFLVFVPVRGGGGTALTTVLCVPSQSILNDLIRLWEAQAENAPAAEQATSVQMKRRG